MRDAGYRIQDAGCGIQDTGCGMRDTGYGIRDAGCGIQDAGYRIQDAGYMASVHVFGMGMLFAKSTSVAIPKPVNSLPMAFVIR
jgi:hypothetical protein